MFGAISCPLSEALTLSLALWMWRVGLSCQRCGPRLQIRGALKKQRLERTDVRGTKAERVVRELIPGAVKRQLEEQ